MIALRKGFDIPVSGTPEQSTCEVAGVRRVALLGGDYGGLRPRVRVEEGMRVRRGELLFEDRRNPGVRFTSPGAGQVLRVNRGERRALVSIEIGLSPSESQGRPEDDELVTFVSWTGRPPSELKRQDVVDLLVESGLWTALRTRPFSKVPAIDSASEALFVTAMDTHPLCAQPEPIIAAAREPFLSGLEALSRLTDGPTYLCVAPGSTAGEGAGKRVRVEEFCGPHPAGLAGTHIHFLHPVDRGHTVWHVGYQDVIAVGRLFESGRLPVERVVALGGPPLASPRLVRTRLGASVEELLEDESLSQDVRVISGSILSGCTAEGPTGYLGRYHSQVSVLDEGRGRELLGWLAPGRRKLSTVPAFISSLFRRQTYHLTTSTNGSRRAMVPIGTYERVMPLDILPTFLLRSLAVGDVERAEQLGCLELDEEDLDLCSFVCPGKVRYGPLLRQVLQTIEEEA